MGQLLILAAVVTIFLLATEVFSDDPKVTPATNSRQIPPPKKLVNIIERVCLSPDLMDSMSADELQQDADYRSSISEYFLPMPLIVSVPSVEHLSGSGILNLFSEKNFRQNVCEAFVPIQSPLIHYLQNREQCLRRMHINTDLRPLFAFYKAMCANDFEDTLTDVLENVGDECIDSLYQLYHHGVEPSHEISQKCEKIGSKWHEFEDAEISELKEMFLRPLFKNCVLSHVVAAANCGASAEAEFQRLTGRFINAIEF